MNGKGVRKINLRKMIRLHLEMFETLKLTFCGVVSNILLLIVLPS